MARAPKGPRAPTPHVLAAMWLMAQIDHKGGGAAQATPEAFTHLTGSAVSEAKAEKIRDHIDKVSVVLRKKLRRIIDRYHAVKPVDQRKPVPAAFTKAVADRKTQA